MPRPRPLILVVSLAAALAITGRHAAANCGQAFCAVNTDWETQGAPVDAGTRFDLRFEYIDQDQPRAGSDKVALGAVSRHHDEVRTINRNWIGTVDHAFNAHWAVSVSLPFLSRSHDHIHNHHGNQIPEAWSYEGFGDARVLARYQMRGAQPAALSWGLIGGVKLPTGRRDVANEEGEEAERGLQPGTGTTDAVLGGFVHRALDTADVFAQLQAQLPVNEIGDYKPGVRMALDLGMRYPLTDSFALLAQFNFLHRGRDKGEAAEPDDTGGRQVFLSPGASIAIDRAVRLYGFVQVPIYQRVNGVQLTADWAASVGLSVRF